jgi:hypothetical protein
MGQQYPDVGAPARTTVSGTLPKAAPARSPREEVSVKAVHLLGEDRRRLIAEAAYFRAEQRGFVPGSELEDWLAAELEIDALIGDEGGDRA